MKHIIKNQLGRHLDGKIYAHVKAMIHNGLNGTHFDGHRVTVQSDFRKVKERITIVLVEGIK